MTQRGATLDLPPQPFHQDRSAHARLGGAAVRAFVVIASVGNRRLGFVVDRLVGQQDIVIEALGRSLKSVRGFAGATGWATSRWGSSSTSGR